MREKMEGGRKEMERQRENDREMGRRKYGEEGIKKGRKEGKESGREGHRLITGEMREDSNWKPHSSCFPQSIPPSSCSSNIPVFAVLLG